MSNLSPFNFIKEKINSEFDFLDQKRVISWLMVISSNKGSIEFLDGNKIPPTHIEFSGSIRLVFWQSFIQPFLKDIISRMFEKTRNFSNEHNLHHGTMLCEANTLLNKRIQRTFGEMIEVDRKLRGKG